MKVMVLVKATKDSEVGVLPETKMFEEMGAFNDELIKAGILKDTDGLKPSSQGYRVQFKGKEREVVKGPFSQTNELVAGYWIWEVKSLDEAISWVKRCPNPMPGNSEIEIRPFCTLEDFGDAYPKTN